MFPIELLQILPNSKNEFRLQFKKVVQPKIVAPRPVTRGPVPKLQPQARMMTTRLPPLPLAKPQAVVIPAKSIPPPSSIAKSANAVFLGCCRAIKVAKSCERICNFDILNKKTLTGMFLGTDPCPQSYGLDLLQCAAQNDDHTTCCRERGVHKTSAGDKCLGFCNMRPGVNFQVREATNAIVIELYSTNIAAKLLPYMGILFHIYCSSRLITSKAIKTTHNKLRLDKLLAIKPHNLIARSSSRNTSHIDSRQQGDCEQAYDVGLKYVPIYDV
ncbi:unnamed protein product [Strongylus vulgaris]|uniref:Domain of unknown function DB domain-containing protein n=1 Tax=Strongylus vulgaris TaxID=40348 RepID=A0A3P7JFV1_STRVU|nr:unnamed protein product [Strongylus vulgaris]